MSTVLLNKTYHRSDKKKFRENPLVQDIKARIRQLAIDDKQEGAQDRYIFEEPSSFVQRERTCAKYIGKVSFDYFYSIFIPIFSLIAIFYAIWTMMIAFKNAKTDLLISTKNILNLLNFNSFKYNFMLLQNDRPISYGLCDCNTSPIDPRLLRSVDSIIMILSL